MAKKDSHSHTPYIIIGIVIAAILIGFAYFLGMNQPKEIPVLSSVTTPGTASAVASEAYSKCMDNGGFVTTARRGTWGYYQVCNFTDNMTCDLYALYDGDCPIGGVNTIGYDTTDQVFCAQRGGRPQGSNNGQCKMPDGKICATSAVYSGACEPN